MAWMLVGTEADGATPPKTTVVALDGALTRKPRKVVMEDGLLQRSLPAVTVVVDGTQVKPLLVATGRSLMCVHHIAHMNIAESDNAKKWTRSMRRSGQRLLIIAH
jgi:hypothetical protein